MKKKIENEEKDFYKNSQKGCGQTTKEKELTRFRNRNCDCLFVCYIQSLAKNESAIETHQLMAVICLTKRVDFGDCRNCFWQFSIRNID